jgi:hypothetical protein
MYVSRDTEALSCRLGYGGIALSITYVECAFVVLGIEHELSMRNIVICGLFGSSIFFHIILRFSKNKLLNTRRVH